MGYTDTLLASGERIVRNAHQHWFILVGGRAGRSWASSSRVAPDRAARDQPDASGHALGHPRLGCRWSSS